MSSELRTSPAERPSARIAIVVDQDLPKGLAANAAALLTLTLGALEPAMPGADMHDASGAVHRGLFPAGLPVLGAERAALSALRDEAAARGLTVVDLPAHAQATNDYDELTAHVAASEPAALAYLAVLVCGPSRAVRSLTGRLSLLR
jgi:hypothetical protein